MVNLRFGSYEQFVNFYKNANNATRNILNKVYPEFRRRLQDDYFSAIKKIGTNKDSTPKLTTEKVAYKTTPTVKSVSRFAKGIIPKALGGVGAAWTILDPKTTWNQKVLGGMMAIPATAPYALGGLIATDLVPKAIDSYYDKKFSQDKRYNLGAGELPNAYNMAPELKELTPEERQLYDDYVLRQSAQTRAAADETLARGTNEIGAWNNLITYGSSAGAPTQQLDYSSNNISSYPISVQSPQTLQNTPQIYSSVSGNISKPVWSEDSIESPTAASSGTNININQEAPDWRRFNAGVTARLQDLYDKVYTQPITEGQQQMDNQAGYNALVNLLQSNEATRRQQALQGSQILKQYQQALDRDRMINATNQAINALTAGTQRAPIAYVGAQGNLNTIELDQPTKQALLPTNTNVSTSDYLNALELQQKLTPKQDTNLAQQALTATALGQQYGVDPLIFMNKDLAQEFMKGRNTLENTQMTGVERRKDIPLTAESDVIKANATAAGNILLEQAKGYYDILNTQLQQAGLDKRQAQQLANARATTKYIQEMQTYRQDLSDAAALERAMYSGQTQRDVANIYANRPSNQGQITTPLEYAKAIAPVIATVYSIQNPVQRQQFLNMVDPTGTLFGNSQGMTPSQFNTTIDEQAILRNARNR